MRLSKTQKDILFMLYAIAAKGNENPVPSTALYNMINSSRTSNIYDTNFRASCHKLNEHGLINKYRSPSLKLAWKLSELGAIKAKEIYNLRVK